MNILLAMLAVLGTLAFVVAACWRPRLLPVVLGIGTVALFGCGTVACAVHASFPAATLLALYAGLFAWMFSDMARTVGRAGSRKVAP